MVGLPCMPAVRASTFVSMDPETYRESVVVALVETQQLVNVAGAVRAMMNMGLRRLRLIKPVEYDTYRIEGIAHGG